MANRNLERYWVLAIISLLVVIAVSSTVVWLRFSRGEIIEIRMPSSEEVKSEVYISGAVTTPGFYPIKLGDNIEDIIQSAGGTTSNADISQLKLYIPESGGKSQTQKVNINCAETWLLQALSGIGEIRAQAIVDYRQQEGLFKNINELTKVEGIGITIFDNIKHLITVAD